MKKHILEVEEVIELASELANRELTEKWDYRYGYMETEIDGVICYTEIAQKKFDALYDKYYDMIVQFNFKNDSLI
jgi:hypothetical protein